MRINDWIYPLSGEKIVCFYPVPIQENYKVISAPKHRQRYWFTN